MGTFADGLPWVHFDIAGTAYLSKERGVDPRGATGVLVRTISDWILRGPRPSGLMHMLCFTFQPAFKYDEEKIAERSLA